MMEVGEEEIVGPPWTWEAANRNEHPSPGLFSPDLRQLDLLPFSLTSITRLDSSYGSRDVSWQTGRTEVGSGCASVTLVY